MAGQASNPVPVPQPVAVIGQQFLTQDTVNLKIANDVSVIDANGTLIFSVKSKSTAMHDLRHLIDDGGNILVTLKPKIKTMHGRSEVFRGDSTDEKDLLFSVTKPNKKEIDVFLASNTSESVPDFKVEDSNINLGESNVIIAEMVEKTVKVYPNVDYAFVVALGLVVGDKSHAGCSWLDMKLGLRVAKVAMSMAGFGVCMADSDTDDP